MDKKKLEVFKNAPIHIAVFKNIIPSILGMLMVLIYNLADTLFIGMTGNDDMVASVSVATPAFVFFMVFGLLFGIGGTSFISRMLGEGKEKKAKQASSFCFWTGLAIGSMSALIVFINSWDICHLVGAKDSLMDYTQGYIRIVCVGIPFLIVSTIFNHVIRAEGNAVLSLIGMIVGNLINIVLDYVMILKFGWGIEGAALATVIGNVCSATIYIFYLSSKKSLLSISLKDYSIRNSIARGVLSIGIPASLNNLLITISTVLINRAMIQYGELAVAGLGVGMKVNMIVIFIIIGLGTGIQPLLGFCYGSRNKKRYVGILKFSIMLATVISLMLTLISYVFAKDLVNVFLNEKEAVDYGIAFARIYIYSGPIFGVLFVLINAIQSTGSAIQSLILSISRQGFVYIPVLIIIDHYFNSYRLLAAAQPISDYCAFTLAIVLFIGIYKTKIAKFPQENHAEDDIEDDIEGELADIVNEEKKKELDEVC